MVIQWGWSLSDCGRWKRGRIGGRGGEGKRCQQSLLWPSGFGLLSALLFKRCRKSKSELLFDILHLRDSKYLLLIPLHSKLYFSESKRHSFICRNNAEYNETTTDHQLVVDGLPPVPNANDIRSLFGRFGAVIRVRVEEKLHRAFVAFSTAKALQMAMAADPPRLKGLQLRVFLPEDHKRKYASTYSIHLHSITRSLLAKPMTFIDGSYKFQ